MERLWQETAVWLLKVKREHVKLLNIENGETVIMKRHEVREEMEERKAKMSRMAIREHFAQNVAMNAGVKLRKAALEALPEPLREEARQPDLTPFPVLRRVFTETAPIPGFQAEVRRTDRN